jgi:hypothetical protein
MITICDEQKKMLGGEAKQNHWDSQGFQSGPVLLPA